jgi:DNA-binding response OmpR family regulator
MDTKLKRILLVEDERPYLRVLNLKLQKAGYEVQGVDNGSDALRILGSEKFDLLILDIVMPDINGFEILDSLKKQRSRMPIIVLSNLSQDEDKKKIAEYGITAFLEKSDCTIVEVIQKVKTQLRS